MMEEEKTPIKEAKVEESVSTAPFKDFRNPFTISLYINDNAVSCRYFRVHNLKFDSLESVDLRLALDEVVRKIQSDLEYKSRIYQYYTADAPVKMTGFINELPEELDGEERRRIASLITSDSYRGSVTLPNGKVIEKSYIEYPPYEDTYGDYERPEYGEITFKFVFAFNDTPLYSRVWDGNVYPKHVRHSLDLTNSDDAYADKDPSNLRFVEAMARRMSLGRRDLIQDAVDLLSGILTGTDVEKDDKGEPDYLRYDYYENKPYENKLSDKSQMTKVEILGHVDVPVEEEKEYFCSTYNKPYVDGWRQATAEKTRKHLRWVNNEIPQWLYDKVERM